MSLATGNSFLGLSSQEARTRLLADGPNELPESRLRSPFRRIADLFAEPMLVLLAAAGVINFVLSEPLDGVLLFLSVLVVVGISLYQEGKTERALLALREMSAPRALVVRDGRQLRVPSTEVVVGDELVLQEGDRVSADAMLIEASNVVVDESLLTGESVSVNKTPRHAELPTVVDPPGGDDKPTVLAALLYVPAACSALDFGVVAPGDLAMPIAAALASVAWFEGYKVLHRRMTSLRP